MRTVIVSMVALGVVASALVGVPSLAVAATTGPAPTGPAPTVGASIPVASQGGNTVNAAAGVYYTSEGGNSNLVVVSETTHQQVGTIATDDIPVASIFDATSKRLYAALSDDDIEVIDTTSGTKVGTISDLPNTRLLGLWMNEVTNTLYLANGNNPYGQAQITAVNATTDAITAVAYTDQGVFGLAVDPVRGIVDVSETIGRNGGGEIVVLNGQTLGTISTHFYRSSDYNQQFSDIALDPLTNTIYVAFALAGVTSSANSQGVYVINGSTFAISNTMVAYDALTVDHLYLDESRGLLYALTTRSSVVDPSNSSATIGLVNVFATKTNSYVDELQLGTDSNFAGLDTATGTLTVYNQGGPSLSVITPPAEQNVFRFNRGAINDHFYTMDVVEAEGIERLYPGTWTYEGVAFQAFGTQVTGTEPLFRFWSNTLQGHFFTADQSERDEIIAKYPTNVWDYEGVDFYVYPDTPSMPNTTEIARFWSPTYGQHFYTEDPVETAGIRANDPPSIWTFEGYNFRVPSN